MQVEYLYCTKNLGPSFKKGKKYLVKRIIKGGYHLINEQGNGHDVTNVYDGWVKYFKTSQELREYKLKRIVK